MSLTRIIISTAAGALLGFGYYQTVGCSTGACPLTSNVWITSIYGAVMGLLIGLG